MRSRKRSFTQARRLVARRVEDAREVDRAVVQLL